MHPPPPPAGDRHSMTAPNGGGGPGLTFGGGLQGGQGVAVPNWEVCGTWPRSVILGLSSLAFGKQVVSLRRSIISLWQMPGTLFPKITTFGGGGMLVLRDYGASLLLKTTRCLRPQPASICCGVIFSDITMGPKAPGTACLRVTQRHGLTRHRSPVWPSFTLTSPGVV